MPSAKDLTGQRFGRLTVLSPSKERGRNGEIIWECLCDCGTRVLRKGSFLRDGVTPSCGCYNIERLLDKPKKDLTGQRFGRLVAVRPTEKRSTGAVMWECQCDCGNVVTVRRNSLIGGNTKSCGCWNIAVATERAVEKAAVDCQEDTRLSYLTDTMFKNNTSGVKGVSFHKPSGLWIAKIGFKKKVYYLGCYKNKERAITARKVAEDELWKPFIEERLGHFKTEQERKEKLEAYLKRRIAERIPEDEVDVVSEPVSLPKE